MTGKRKTKPKGLVAVVGGNLADGTRFEVGHVFEELDAETRASLIENGIIDDESEG